MYRKGDTERKEEEEEGHRRLRRIKKKMGKGIAVTLGPISFPPLFYPKLFKSLSFSFSPICRDIVGIVWVFPLSFFLFFSSVYLGTANVCPCLSLHLPPRVEP